MRLSEAIRLGALLKPQSYDELFTADGKSCALGAACDAVGIKSFDRDDSDFELHALECEFPILNLPARCPACSTRLKFWQRRKDLDVEDVIVHLNDDHGWNRHRIADWVQSIEPADAEPVAVAAVRLSVEEPVVTTRV